MNGIIENVRTTAVSSAATHQELLRKWISLWPGLPVSIIPLGELQRVQTKWVEMVGDLVQRQNDALAVQFKMGFGAIEKLCHLAQEREPQELRNQTVEFWQKAVDDLCLISDHQIRSLQYAVAKLTEPAAKECKPAAPHVPSPAANGAKVKAIESAKAAVKPKSDREELDQLKEAMEEYEMTRGDWSKGR